MNLETAACPWTHDELQLIGAELGDTINFTNENNDVKTGIIVFLTKTVVFVLTENQEIFKFGRITLTTTDNKWELIGLCEQPMRISKKQWDSAKKEIDFMLKRKKKK